MPTSVLAHGTASLAGEGVPGALLYGGLVVGTVIGALALRARGPAPVGGPAVAPLTLDGSEAGPWPGDALPRPVRIGGQVVGLVALALVLVVGWLGSDLSGLNPTPLFLVAVVWWGVPLLSLLLGDWWRVVDPFDALAAVAERVRGGSGAPPAPLPSDAEEAGDWWVPAALLASFAWMLTCWLEGIGPRNLAAWVTALTLVMLVGAIVAGRRWVRRCSPLGVLCGTIAAASPVAIEDGTVRFRSPFRGLARRAGGRRSFAAVATVLGATAWEAVAGTQWWSDVTGASTGTRGTLWSTLGLVWCILLIAGAWLLVIRGAEALADRAGGDPPLEPLGVDVAVALGPLAAVAVFVHQIEVWLIYLQDLVVLGLDPFSRGWDLGGTSSWRTNEELLSPGWRSAVQLGLLALALGIGLGAGWDRVAARVGADVSAAGWAVAGWTAGAGAVVLWLLLGA